MLHSTKQTLNTKYFINHSNVSSSSIFYTVPKYWGNICHRELGDVLLEGFPGERPLWATRLFAIIPWGSWGCFEEAREEKRSGADD